MKRVGLALATLSLVLALSPISPAWAAGVWDPNEPGHRLDIRRVGAYEQADGRLRVTVSFHDRLRLRWFSSPTWPELPTLHVGFTHDREIRPYLFAIFFRDRSGRLTAAMCESGSGCGQGRVSRPNAFTVRAWFGAVDHWPRAGWSFLGRSTLGMGQDAVLLDRTRWGRVT